MPWSELERLLSGPCWAVLRATYHFPGDGGDSPAWSRKRQPFEPPAQRAATGSVPYAELHCHSNFSFLDGASHPEELVEEAVRLGLEALALTDHDGFYGVVRFAEAARAFGLPTVFGAELTLDLHRKPMGDPIPAAGRPRDGRTTSWCWPATRRATPAGPGDQRGAAAGREGHAASTRWPSWAPSAAWVRRTTGTGWCSPDAARARCRARSCATVRRPRRTSSTASSRCSAATTWPSSCGTTAIRSTRPATTRWPSSPSAPGSTCVATNNVHYATPARRPLATALAAVRARRSLDELDGWLPAASARAPAVRRRAEPVVSLAIPAWSNGPRSSARACAFDLASGRARTCRRTRAPTVSTRWGCSAKLTERGATDVATGPGGEPRTAKAVRRRSTTSSTSSKRSASPATSSSCGTSSSSAGGPTSSARVGARRPTRRSVTRSASPRPTRSRSACCSSGSSHPSATARPTSTSTSRATAARRSSSTSTSATAAQLRRAGRQRHHLPGQVVGPRHGQGARATRPASRTPGRSRSTAGARSTRRSSSNSTSIDDPRQPVLDLADAGRALPAPSRHPLGRHGALRPPGRSRCARSSGAAWQGPHRCLQWDKDDCAAAGLVKFDLLGSRACSPRCTTRSTSSPTRHDDRHRSGHHPAGRRRLRHVVRAPTPSGCSRSRAGPRWPRCRGCGPARSTTSWSRWR